MIPKGEGSQTSLACHHHSPAHEADWWNQGYCRYSRPPSTISLADAQAGPAEIAHSCLIAHQPENIVKLPVKLRTPLEVPAAKHHRRTCILCLLFCTASNQGAACRIYDAACGIVDMWVGASVQGRQRSRPSHMCSTCSIIGDTGIVSSSRSHGSEV